MTPRDAGARVGLRIDAKVWREEVERYERRSVARTAAERERARLEIDGLRLTDVKRCAAEGSDGTRLGGLVKAYVPISTGPSSERPFGFIFSPGRDDRGPYLAFIAFGERHPRPRVRSVAHKRRHGRYPDQ